MSLSHSPKVVTDGLVFYYDMNNTQKSWKGKPTTNHLSTGTSGYTAFTPSGWNDTTMPQVGTSEFNTPIFKYDTTIVVYVYTHDNVLADDFAAFSGQQVTFSLYMRRVEGDVTGRIRTYDNVSGYSYQNVSATQTFQRFQMTKTIGASPTRMFVMIDNTGGGTYEFHSPQIELGTFATPFINGTRSNAQAIVDLTNNHTVTATGLTYASDNTFSFNGSSDYITTSYNLSDLSNVWTIECWCYPNSTQVANADIWGNHNNVDGCVLQNVSGTTYSVAIGNGSSWQGWTVSNVTIPALEWSHIIVVVSNGTLTIYRNGVSVASQAITGTIVHAGNYFKIGNGHATALRPFNGKIHKVSIYKKDLSLAEVKQNFNASRGRYGI